MVNGCLCVAILISSVVLRMSLPFSILKLKASNLRTEPDRTYTTQRIWNNLPDNTFEGIINVKNVKLISNLCCDSLSGFWY